MNHQDRVVIRIPERTRFATTDHRGSSSSANVPENAVSIDGDTTPSLAAMSEDPDPRHGQEGAEIGRESSMPFSGQEGRHANFDQTLRLDQRLADVEKQLGIECKDRSNFKQRLLAAKNKLVTVSDPWISPQKWKVPLAGSRKAHSEALHYADSGISSKEGWMQCMHTKMQILKLPGAWNDLNAGMRVRDFGVQGRVQVPAQSPIDGRIASVRDSQAMPSANTMLLVIVGEYGPNDAAGIDCHLCQCYPTIRRRFIISCYVERYRNNSDIDLGDCEFVLRAPGAASTILSSSPKEGHEVRSGPSIKLVEGAGQNTPVFDPRQAALKTYQEDKNGCKTTAILPEGRMSTILNLVKLAKSRPTKDQGPIRSLRQAREHELASGAIVWAGLTAERRRCKDSGVARRDLVLISKTLNPRTTAVALVYAAETHTPPRRIWLALAHERPLLDPNPAPLEQRASHARQALDVGSCRCGSPSAAASQLWTSLGWRVRVLARGVGAVALALHEPRAVAVRAAQPRSASGTSSITPIPAAIALFVARSLVRKEVALGAGTGGKEPAACMATPVLCLPHGYSESMGVKIVNTPILRTDLLRLQNLG
ncbi:hypothetical protein B0H11DRAFT_1915010 [Mycena galericulata]|nr:hypothetical protein B0H11DRAFT_1915010 [Mycena galericulata]